jgi:emp24/gp25L/p24 family/GOLD
MTIYGPRNNILNTVRHQSQNEIKVKPMETGEHKICFSHASSYKLQTINIDFTLNKLEGHPDLKKEDVSGPQDPAAQLAKKLEKTGEHLQRDLTDLLHTLRHLRNREKRNLETVLSISSRIFGFCLLEMALVVGMSVLQVVVMQSLFTSTGKMRV